MRTHDCEELRDAHGGMGAGDDSYYVTVVDGKRHGFLLGPYATHDEALANVDRGRTLACERDSFAHFYSFGTARAYQTRVIGTVFGV